MSVPQSPKPRAQSLEPGVQSPEPFSLHPVHLDGFDGPLDLLLYLVKDEQMDISQVSIASIADQYLEFIYLMPLLAPQEFEAAADFLTVAALLALLKSKSLLPVETQEEAEEEPEAQELLQRLMEYEQFTAPADWLWNRFRQFSRMFPRGLSELQAPELDLGDISLFDLATAFHDLLEKAKPESPTDLSPSRVNLQQQMERMLLSLRSAHGPLTLVELVGERASRITILACFLALLELVKARKVTVSQSSPYGPITVRLPHGPATPGSGLSALGRDTPKPKA